MKSFDIS